MMALLQQLLYSESLSLSWRDIIVPVVRQVVQTVRPDVRSCDDDMDIRQLVHIKKVRMTVTTLLSIPDWACATVSAVHSLYSRFPEGRSLTLPLSMALHAPRTLPTKR